MDHAVAKVEQAVAARRGTDLMIIARTNAARSLGLDEALRRGEAFRRAGADMLLVLPKTPDQTRLIGERLGPPLMYMTLQGGLSAIGHSANELHQLGYRLVVDPATPLLAAFEAMRCAYREIAAWQPHPALGAAGGEREIQVRIHDVIGLEALLDIERKTVEHPSAL